MKNSFLIFTVIIICGCNKAHYHDLDGSGSLSGVVVVMDTLNGSYKITVAKNITVYLKAASQTEGFLYSVPANSEGFYSFNGIDTTANYVIFSRVDTGAVKYYGILSYTGNTFDSRKSDTLKLYPAEDNQNGIHLIIQDESKQRISNVNAWVFTSQLLFSGGTSEGKSFDMTSNMSGVSNIYNITEGTYYFRVKTKFNTDSLNGVASVTITKYKIQTVILTLSKIPLNKNGFELLVTDNQTPPAPVAGAYVYTYRSKSIYDLDTTYTSGLYNDTTNISGICSRYNLAPGTYYFNVLKKVGKDSLLAKDIVVVESNVITKKTIVIH